MAALAAVAQRPPLIIKLFETKTCNVQGIFQIRLFIHGKWTTVIIDSQLPCDIKGDSVFSSFNKELLWVALLEKAVAKVYGCYEALAFGHGEEGNYFIFFKGHLI